MIESPRLLHESLKTERKELHRNASSSKTASSGEAAANGAGIRAEMSCHLGQHLQDHSVRPITFLGASQSNRTASYSNRTVSQSNRTVSQSDPNCILIELELYLNLTRTVSQSNPKVLPIIFLGNWWEQGDGNCWNGNTIPPPIIIIIRSISLVGSLQVFMAGTTWGPMATYTTQR